MLDTSVVIDLPVARVAELVTEVAVSTITLAELAFGLHAADPLVRASREARYQRVLRTMTPLGYDEDAALVFGALCEAVRLSGRNPRPRRFDMLIASVAVSRGIPLLTRNPVDFEGLPAALQVLDV